MHKYVLAGWSAPSAGPGRCSYTECPEHCFSGLQPTTDTALSSASARIVRRRLSCWCTAASSDRLARADGRSAEGGPRRWRWIMITSWGLGTWGCLGSAAGRGCPGRPWCRRRCRPWCRPGGTSAGSMEGGHQSDRRGRRRSLLGTWPPVLQLEMCLRSPKSMRDLPGTCHCWGSAGSRDCREQPAETCPSRRQNACRDEGCGGCLKQTDVLRLRRLLVDPSRERVL